MRRPRPHRLTGSVRRLLAAAALAALAAAFAVTSAARPASAAGLTLNLGIAGLNVNLPALPTLPLTTPTPTPTASTSAPGLPGGTTLPPVCPVGCAPTSAAAVNGNTGTTPGGAHPGSSSASPTRAAVGGGAFGSSSGPGSAATSTVTVPQSVGLAVSPPPPVEQLTPLAGISFGQAPYLWPLFILLDLAAVGAVVVLVRRTWSPTSGAD
jgi:hypothetical protein